jgi:hypothetical protein
MTDSITKAVYTNYRGETSERRLTPKGLRYGASEWHREPQWLLTAYDWDKEADREFALCDFRPDAVFALTALQEQPEARATAAEARVKGLVAEIERLIKVCDEWSEVSRANSQRATAAEAEVERLKAKLREEENTRLKQVGELAGELVRLHAALGWAET